MVDLNVEISVELKKALGKARIDRDMTTKAAVAEALKVWLAGPASRSTIV